VIEIKQYVSEIKINKLGSSHCGISISSDS